MWDMDTKQQIQADKDLIQELGGPSKVAELLEYDKSSGGVQRVQNWTTRGIPAKVKLARPDLFLGSATSSSADPIGTQSFRESQGPIGRAPIDPSKEMT